MTQLLEDRLQILAGAARYDASCASSGSRRRNPGGLGNGAFGGVCHSWSADGRCISLLKILLTNVCIFDCAYCVNRRSNDIERTAFTPEEVAELTMQLYRRNCIEGLFLSTGVVRSPDFTMELLLRAVRLLRQEHRFGGYIHLKIVPGADPLLVEQAGRLADRVSVNIELPSAESLGRIAPDKSREAILQPMRQVSGLIVAGRDERRGRRKAPDFAPAGQSTQLIVGASPESDLQILQLAQGLYRRLELRRVYYSAFVPVGDSRVPAIPAPPLQREHRLYQADWLLRFYGFAADELLDADNPDFDPRFDPKAAWALRHPEFFPVDVQSADHEALLRVPGIGVRSAQRILRARRVGRLALDDLKQLGVVLKRARHFITLGGRAPREVADLPLVRERLLEYRPEGRAESRQLELFAPRPEETVREVISGEF
ncbi:MAG: putative DNA modification/repair radical SAM protein [Desulfuromonadales bacterium]|nr:putative DNA modification/repair radical SAM protein [Desulfuromonadales bacterium]